MNPALILTELRTPGSGLPERAILAAMDDPPAITPGLLAFLEEALADPLGYMDEAGHSAHIIALYLLAQFREPRALPPLLAMVRLTEEEQDALLGDLITEGLASLLATLCAEETGPLEDLATDPGVDLYVRNAAMDALLVLGFQGILEPERFQELFGNLLATFEERGREEDSLAWANLVSSCAIAGFRSFLPRLQEAYARGLVDEDIMDLEDLEEALARNQAHYQRRFLKDHHTIEDALLELEDHPWLVDVDATEDGLDADLDEDGDEEEEDGDDDDEPITAIPALSPETRNAVIARQGRPAPDPSHPARNAPCPCGSGKKYKRCCGKA